MSVLPVPLLALNFCMQVLVLRLMTEGSIEQHIIQKAEEKKRFADSSITGEAYSVGGAVPDLVTFVDR